jgi:hypothetical protein
VVRKINTSGTIFTIAGNGTAGFSGDGGAATAARLDTPWNVAADGAGNVYIADANNNRIRKVNAAGIITTFAGTGTPGFSGDGAAATLAQLSNPQGICTDFSGNVFIFDVGNNRVRKVSSTGIISTVAGAGPTVAYGTGDGGPATAAGIGYGGVVVDGTGNLYIAGLDAVRKVNASGIISTVAGQCDSIGFGGDGGPAIHAKMSEVMGAAIDVHGNMYIADAANYRIRYIPALGSPTPTGVETLQAAPNQLAVYPNPAASSITVSVTGYPGTLAIMDGLGRQMSRRSLETGNCTIDVASIPRGIYFVMWAGKNAATTAEKIVLE